MLDIVRAGRGRPALPGRLYRTAQDHVGDRLSAPGRVLPGRAKDDRKAARRPVSRHQAWRHGRRRDGVLRSELTRANISTPALAGVCPRSEAAIAGDPPADEVNTRV